MGYFVKSRQGPQWVNSIFLVAILGLFLAALSGKAQDEAPRLVDATCSWGAPTYGTPVHHYVLQLVKLGGAAFDTTTFDSIQAESTSLELELGYTYKARVAGVDAQGRQGPWSLWTPVYGPRVNAGGGEDQ